MTDHDALARRIADDIMTGDGERAVRLELVDVDGHAFGAWSSGPLTDLIARHLREAAERELAELNEDVFLENHES